MIIDRPDQHLATYIYAKQASPRANLVWRSFQKKMVDAVDKIVELAHGERDYVRGDNDWRIVEALLKFFADEWPNEFNELKSSIPDIRESRKDGGYSESKEMKYVGAIPPRFMKMVKAIFPAQQWDKKFVNKFVKKFPLFKVGGV